jgi:hypothetical protein
MNNTQNTAWTKTQDTMPEVGQKVVVFLWMDETVSQAWWNGEHYVLAAPNEEGKLTIYEVLPFAISHWHEMPTMPHLSSTQTNHQWDEHPQLKVVH